MKKNLNHKLTGTQHAICRSPLFSLETTLEQAWPQLKRIIQDSAPGFFPFIAELDADGLAGQPEKIRHTVWKYFNRSRYRSTPFGEFAALSLVANGIHTANSSHVILQEKMEVGQWPDWDSIPTVSFDNKSLRGSLFRSNPSCYAYAQEYRYLYRDEQGFSLNVIPQREDVDILLEYCRKGRGFFDIADCLYREIGLDERNLLSLLKQMLELQVLECDLQPNITGLDYFERKGIKGEAGNTSYRIASRAVVGGGLSVHLNREITEYATFMHNCLTRTKNVMLEQFRSDFMHRWEQQSVPLSLALDPIMGIGYGRNGDLLQPSLAGELQGRSMGDNIPKITYGPFQQFLLTRMVRGKGVQLADYQAGQQDRTADLPNTFGVLFHIYEGRPVIHHAGGASSSALLGRFTPINEIYDYALVLTSIEQEANPEALFFDIAYQCEGYTDNVNRRRLVYKTELALGSWSTADDPLRLEDIMVSIREGKIVLHHREHGKKLVPRLASAYNHQRSDLDLFRFLCDLQYEGLHGSLTVDLSAIFPGLESYPRAYFKEMIVCPAKWRLPLFKERKELELWLKGNDINAYFTIGHSDQTLTINPSDPDDLEHLLIYQRQQGKDVYITEALVDGGQVVKDEQGKAYHCQFMAHLHHSNTNYHRNSFRKTAAVLRDLRMPGSEWLYMELYMSQAVMDGFLDKEVRELLRSQRSVIREWFFIRYNHPEHHIRLRLKLTSPEHLPAVLKRVQLLMNISNEYGQLRRLEIKGYEREISRYGLRQMDMVEHFFHLDSVWSMKQLKLPVEQRYREIFEFAGLLCREVYPERDQQLMFYKEMAGSYAAEMSFSHADYKRINSSFHHFAEMEHQSSNARLLRCFKDLVQRYAPNRQRELLADLIHLHINRRFCGAQRLHEAIIYQYLFRSALTMQHR